MSGKSVLTDTNVLIYLLNGSKTAAELLEDKEIIISFISEIELFSYKALSAKETRDLNRFLNDCKVIESNKRINQKAAELRRSYKIELPDAIIFATALIEEVPLVTADRELIKVGIGHIIKYSPNAEMP